MAFGKFPPAGYNLEEYPLPHTFVYDCDFGLESAVADVTTICPIIVYTEEAGAVETIEVNPRNANFAQDTGPLIHPGSIVPKISVSMSAFLNEAAIAEGVRRLNFFTMPIYSSFDSLDAFDEKTGATLLTTLGMEKNGTPQRVGPNFNTVNLKGGSDYPLSTIPFTQTATTAGLTTDASMEGIAFSLSNYWNAMRFQTNRNMLKKVTGQMKLHTMTDRFNFHSFSNNFTYPTVKRGNPFTFCGVLVHIPQAESEHQMINAGEITDISHMTFRMRISFDEWNPQFDQTPI